MRFINPFTRKKKVHKVGNKEVTLVECYRDELGNVWKEPTDMTDYPYGRLSQIFEYSKYANFKLTKETLSRITKAILKACNEGEYNDVVLLAREIEVAETLFCERSTLLNLASSMYLINDEEPNSWNETYHKQKIKAMENDADCMAFFLPKAYQQLESYKENSNLQVIEYLQGTMKEMERLNFTLQTISQRQQTITT